MGCVLRPNASSHFSIRRARLRASSKTVRLEPANHECVQELSKMTLFLSNGCFVAFKHVLNTKRLVLDRKSTKSGSFLDCQHTSPQEVFEITYNASFIYIYTYIYIVLLLLFKVDLPSEGRKKNCAAPARGYSQSSPGTLVCGSPPAEPSVTGRLTDVTLSHS